MKWINFLKANAKLMPDKVAIIDQKTKKNYTYSELDLLSDCFAIFLKTQGLVKDDRVAILAHNRIEHISLLFAAAKVGVILVPLNFRLADEEIKDILSKIDAKILFGESEVCPFRVSNYFNLNTLETCMEYEQILSEEDFSSLEDDILMQFSSGSTGEPKGVLMHGKMLRTNQIETCANWKLNKDDITLVETPFFHTGGYNVLCLPLLFLGGQVILAEKFDVENIFKTFQDNKISVYFGVPTMFSLISVHEKFSEFDFSSIRFFVSGGAACPVELIETYQQKNIPFKQGFGLTEVGPNCFLLEQEDAIKKLGSIGKPMHHSLVQVRRDDGSPAHLNEIGELLIKGDHLCHGYFKEHERFLCSCEDGYFKTGDLVRFDEDGFFFVVGRKKDMYISGGENVYPGEVEKSLSTLKGIREAVVVSVPDAKWGEVGFAFLETEFTHLTVEDVRTKLSNKLSRYKHPHYIKAMHEWPLLANGKIDRRKLKQIAMS